MKKGKIYTKTHKSPKALIDHVAKVRARGGHIKTEGMKVIYYF
jgi:hypothetical protein